MDNILPYNKQISKILNKNKTNGDRLEAGPTIRNNLGEIAICIGLGRATGTRKSGRVPALSLALLLYRPSNTLYTNALVRTRKVCGDTTC